MKKESIIALVVIFTLLLAGCGDKSATEEISETTTVESESTANDKETAQQAEAPSSNSELPRLFRDLGLGVEVTGTKDDPSTQYQYRSSESSYDAFFQSSDNITEPILNSVIDHPLIGNESDFVYVQKVDKDGHFRVVLGLPDQPVKIEPGNYYDIIMFLRNDATTQTQADRERLVTPPLDGIIMVPTVITPEEEKKIACTVGRSVLMNEEGERTEPEINSIYSGVTVCVDEPVRLLHCSNKLLIFFGEGYKEGFSNDVQITTMSSKGVQSSIVWPTFTIKRSIFPSEEGSFLIYTVYAEAAEDEAVSQ